MIIAIGPYEVLTYLPGADMVICAEEKGVVDDYNDLVHLRVDATFADVPPSAIDTGWGGRMRTR